MIRSLTSPSIPLATLSPNILRTAPLVEVSHILKVPLLPATASRNPTWVSGANPIENTLPTSILRLTTIVGPELEFPFASDVDRELTFHSLTTLSVDPVAMNPGTTGFTAKEVTG